MCYNTMKGTGRGGERAYVEVPELLWSEEARPRRWLEMELAVVDTWAALGVVSTRFLGHPPSGASPGGRTPAPGSAEIPGKRWGNAPRHRLRVGPGQRGEEVISDGVQYIDNAVGMCYNKMVSSCS